MILCDHLTGLILVSLDLETMAKTMKINPGFNKPRIILQPPAAPLKQICNLQVRLWLYWAASRCEDAHMPTSKSTD